jgi:hypothetical protein
MKAKDFKIGAEVINRYGDRGKVISNDLSNKDSIAVEWFIGGVQAQLVNEVQLVDGDLIADFNEIKACLYDATKSIKRAVDLATQNKMALINLSSELSLDDFFEACNEVNDNGGWTASSAQC